MDEKEQMKKILNLAEGTGLKKQPKDLYSIILSRLSRSKSHDVRIEYFESLEDLRQIRSAVGILQKNNGINVDEHDKINSLLTKIRHIFDERMKSPESKVDSSNNKYNFREGSSSRFEDYNNVKEAILETDLFNKITKISFLCGEGLEIIGRNVKQFWQKNDMIGEIDPSIRLEVENNG